MLNNTLQRDGEISEENISFPALLLSWLSEGKEGILGMSPPHAGRNPHEQVTPIRTQAKN